MKRLEVIVAAALALTTLAIAPGASASAFDRSCATPRTAFLFGPENANFEMPWEVHGPWHIKMTPRAAYLLARRWPPLQNGYRVSATRDVPCWVARSIAERAARAWQHWPGNRGVVRVSTTGMGPSQYVGRFTCAGRNLPAPDVVRLTCHNGANSIYGSFTISRNPYYPSG